MHATGKILPSPRIRPLPAEQEPYFEEEQVSELGHSFEAAVSLNLFDYDQRLICP